MKILPGAYNPKLPTLMIDVRSGNKTVIEAKPWRDNPNYIEVVEGKQSIFFTTSGTCISGKRILVNFSNNC